MIRNVLSLVSVLSVMIALGCAHYPVNAPLAEFDPKHGYRMSALESEPNTSNLFVILTFSGGGTRAAAFSYGLMEQLAETQIKVDGTTKRLLDEVDVISSVSGGSFTSAYYGAFGDDLFTSFGEEFLYRNVQRDLILRLVAPWNWPRLMSPKFDRIDMASAYYDKYIFHGQRYADLVNSKKPPFIIVNATDMALGSRFEFTQSQFDSLYSDLNTVSLARSVAASSAFPGAATPLRVRNYENPASGVESEPTFKGEPIWLNDAITDQDRAAPKFYQAKEVVAYTRTKERPYIHLQDGGLADNIGLRGPLFAMSSTASHWSLLRRMNLEEIDTLLVITVNAKVGADKTKINRKEHTPSLLKVFGAITTTPMANYSSDTVLDFHKSFDQWRKDQQSDRDDQELLHEVAFFDVHVSFDTVPDKDLRKVVKTLPTSFKLKRDQIDALRRAATQSLGASESYKEFLSKFEK